MPVVTEAKARKLFKENEICENGTFVLKADEKLTPAAKGFLADRHVSIIYSSATSSQNNTVTHIPNTKNISHISESAAFPYVVRLAKLYPILLKAQKAFFVDFDDNSVSRVGEVLETLQQIVNHRIEDDMTMYKETFLSNAELQAIRVAKQLNPNDIVLNYALSDGKLACYEAYMTMAVTRQELDLVDRQGDVFIEKVIQLLKALEVMLWLILE